MMISTASRYLPSLTICHVALHVQMGRDRPCGRGPYPAFVDGVSAGNRLGVRLDKGGFAVATSSVVVLA